MTGANGLSPALLRIKRAVREAVSRMGGTEGAAATTGRTKSTAGRWMNLNEADLPPIDAAFAMDEILVASGAGPLILRAMARELGQSLVAQAESEADSGDFHLSLALISREAGELSAALAEGLRDGGLTKAEREKIRSEIADLQDALAGLSAMLIAGEMI